MITTCKQCDSGGRANERARTGIESERARAVFQNIHSHTGQWTFGCILSGVGEGGSARNAWDLRKEFSGAWEWQCHGSRQRTLLKRRHNRRACLKTPSLLHRLGFSSFYDSVFQGREGCFLKNFSKQTNKERIYCCLLPCVLGGRATKRSCEAACGTLPSTESAFLIHLSGVGPATLTPRQQVQQASNTFIEGLEVK